MIRAATYEDVLTVTHIHVHAMPEDLLPGLGAKFLRQCFYPVCLEKKHSVFLVNCDEENKVQAFAVFAFNTSALTNKVLKHRFSLICAVIKSVLQKPVFLKKICNYLHGFKQNLLDKNFDATQFPELYVIATDPSKQKIGLGTELLLAGLNQLKLQGFRGCVVRTSSKIAKSLYIKNGFVLVGKEYRGAVIMDVLFTHF